jgi:hypothetical protein
MNGSIDSQILVPSPHRLMQERGRDIRAACGQLIVEGGVKKSAAQQMALLMG